MNKKACRRNSRKNKVYVPRWNYGSSFSGGRYEYKRMIWIKLNNIK